MKLIVSINKSIQSEIYSIISILLMLFSDISA